MIWYVWFFKVSYLGCGAYQGCGSGETGYLRSNSDEAITVARQLYDYLGEGFKIVSLQFNGKIIDVAGTPPRCADDNFSAFKAV